MRALPAQTEDELFEGLGPLASQTGRIEIAFAFNLIGSQVRNDLRQINEIRNKFAHVLSGEDWTFEHAEIGRHVDALSLAGTAASVVGSHHPDNRGKFIMTVYHLTGQAGEISNHQQPSYFPKFLADRRHFPRHSDHATSGHRARAAVDESGAPGHDTNRKCPRPGGAVTEDLR